MACESFLNLKFDLLILLANFVKSQGSHVVSLLMISNFIPEVIGLPQKKISFLLVVPVEILKHVDETL